MHKFSKIAVIILLVFSSCKTTKSSVETIDVSAISTKKLISNYYDNYFKQKTIDARINAKYSDNKSSASISIRMRVEKDKTIWMSASKFGIPIAKVKITPSRVSYYEKINRTYFDGDFSLLSQWLGTELDYEKVQNILVGQAVLNLKKGKYDSAMEKNLYQLTPKDQNRLFGILFFMNPENFRINRQEIRNAEKQQFLSVSYPTYKDINGEQFPENINIRAIDNNNLTTINIEYRSVEFNKKLTFPFDFPNGYKEISLK